MDFLRQWLPLLLIASLTAFAFQGSRPLFETTETRYAECAREMAERGALLEPTLALKPHWTKPPMPYWSIMAGTALLGQNEWGVRIGNSVAFFFSALLVAAIATRLFDAPTGRLAGLIYCTSPFPLFAAATVSADTLLALWEHAAIASFLLAQPGNRHEARWRLCMWACLGLGFLTKGPPALLALVPIIAWSVLHRPRPRVFSPAGVLLFVLIGISWFLASCATHPGLLTYLVHTEIIGRVASNSVHNRAFYKAFQIYMPVLILGAGPWLYFAWKLAVRKGLYRPAILLHYLRRDQGPGTFLLWWLMPLLVFMGVRSKLELYVLPLFAAITIAIAVEARHVTTGAAGGRRLKAIALSAGLLVLLCKAGMAGLYPSLTWAQRSAIPEPHKSRLVRVLQKWNKQNAGWLTDELRATAPAGASFAVFNEARLFGVDYYLQGRLSRWADEEGRMYAGTNLAGGIAQIAGDRTRPWVVISHPCYTYRIQRKLLEAGIPFQTNRAAHQALCIVEKLER